MNQNALIKKLKEENTKLSAKSIKDHEKIIELHREIKTIWEQDIEGLKTVVETAVHTSVKKSYSEAAAYSTSTPTTSLPTLMRKAWSRTQQKQIKRRKMLWCLV